MNSEGWIRGTERAQPEKAEPRARTRKAEADPERTS